MSAQYLAAAYSRRPAPKAYDPSFFNVEMARVQKAMPSYVIRAVTSSTILNANDGMLVVDATAGAVTVTLMAPNLASGQPITIKKSDASGNAITIGGTVDGVLNRTLVNQNDSIVLQSDGTTWFRPMLTGSGTGGVAFSLTAGTHLSGGPFNGSSAVTLTTDATSANTASTIVARSASGNFSAGTITVDVPLVVSDANVATARYTEIKNTNTGTAGRAMWLASNSAGSLVLSMQSTGFTPSGTNLANAGSVYTDTAGGLSVGGTAGDLRLYGANVLAGTITATTVTWTSAHTFQATTNFAGVTFNPWLYSTSALATPSAYTGTTFIAFASTVSGATLMGYGTTGDVTLKNRAGTDALIVTANTVDVQLKGKAKVTGAFGCNAATEQTAYASGGALNAYGTGIFGFDSDANASALHALVVKIRAALVANGIMS